MGPTQEDAKPSPREMRRGNRQPCSRPHRGCPPQGDTAARIVRPPPELSADLRRDAEAHAGWKVSSYTSRLEHAEALRGAKKPETRARRLEKVLVSLRSRAARR